MNNQHQSSAQLKASARGVLLGKYGTSIAVMLLCQLILGSVSLFASSMLQSSSLFNTIANYAISLIIELLNGVFFLGQIYFYLNIACNRPYRISNAFYGFHTHTDKAIIVKFLLLIIQILCLAPAILVYLFYKSRPSSFLIMLMTITAVTGMIALTVFSLLFSQVFYLILDFPDKKISELFALSKKIMKGSLGRLLYLHISFIPLCLLALLSCGIGFIFLTPYMNMTFTFFYLDLIHCREGIANPSVNLDQGTLDSIASIPQ